MVRCNLPFTEALQLNLNTLDDHRLSDGHNSSGPTITVWKMRVS